MMFSGKLKLQIFFSFLIKVYYTIVVLGDIIWYID